MSSLERPRLRPLSARRIEHEGRSFAMLQDPLGAFRDPVLVPLDAFVKVCRHFDGENSIEDVRARILAETGEPMPEDVLSRLVSQLDRAMVLDGPRFADYLGEYRRTETRPAALAGRSYSADGMALRAQINGLYAGAGGAGPPALGGPPAERIRGVLSPHIDFGRGGPVYTWAYKALAEQADADVYVILGVAHQPCRRRFALTRKDFETPLGVVRTDREYVERIASIAGDDLFDDELVHRAEHSVEFQTVFLRHVLSAEREFRIVPILAGSFHDLMERGVDPIEDPSVRRFIEALREAERAGGKKVAYIGGIDLCHVGPEFGDAAPVDDKLQETVRAFDREMLDRAAEGDAAGWFRTAAGVSNRYRVCGLAATYTMLRTIGPVNGKLLRYDQALDARRRCCVSFASMVFRAARPDPCPGPPHPVIDGHASR
ncbi:AmmeMemoRadiSam system protein B [Aquisphaera insulae]|uniref:AmmeMemoRadiSam system protein B n=1 Tax=Aquisphaera insulae TaxID=2712864 RepID=UPI0013EAA56C|nr:AmmeMemoRadiSam system protein B [Aquisphaera insulae]